MIPFLVILTIVVIYQVTRPPSEPVQVAQTPVTSAASRPAAATTEDAVPSARPPLSSAPVSADPSPLPGAVPDLTNTDANGHLAASIAAGALPAGADFVAAGAGTWHIVPGTTPTHGAGQQFSTYTIEV